MGHYRDNVLTQFSGHIPKGTSENGLLMAYFRLDG